MLATKEVIFCWSGAALGGGGKVYSVGDRIQIAGHRGVVLDHDIFATKLLEIGPGEASHLYTGRVTVFPNSLLFMGEGSRSEVRVFRNFEPRTSNF